MMNTKIINYTDMLALPFFIALSYYFYKIKNKTPLEYILLLFSIFAFIIDLLFTIYFLRKLQYST